jgi:hypothetical protein
MIFDRAQIAIKVIEDSSFFPSAMNEINITRRLNHPCVLNIIDASVDAIANLGSDPLRFRISSGDCIGRKSRFRDSAVTAPRSRERRRMMEDGPEEGANPARAPQRYTRRLSDKILIAFHQACDQGDFEVADQLLRVLETMVMRRPNVPDVNRRKNIESLVAAHERLWVLRHPESDGR